MNVNPMVVPTLALASILFCVGQHLARTSTSSARMVLLAVLGTVLAAPAVLFAAYYLHFFDQAEWFYELRAARFTEILGGGIGFPAGYLWRALRSGSGATDMLAGSAVPVVALLCLLAPYSKSVLLPIDLATMQDRWSDDICLQSTSSTCGPACVATLLKVSGHDVTERQIALESYACASGTENWYLARALRRRGLAVDFLVVEPHPDALRFPAIAGVNLGGEEGLGHFITVLDHTGEGYVIGDPLRGRLVLSLDETRRRYHFTGFFMVVGAATPEQARRVIDENLLSPERFFAHHPITTVSLTDPLFELRMWRGPAWNSMTYWAARGCLAYGRKDAARRLLEAALDDSAAKFESTGTIWEFYHPHGGDQQEVQRKPHTPYNTPCTDYLGHNPLIAMARMWEAAQGE